MTVFYDLTIKPPYKVTVDQVDCMETPCIPVNDNEFSYADIELFEDCVKEIRGKKNNTTLEIVK